MIAALGMYDMPHARAANDRLWAGVRGALGHGPDTLTRDMDLWQVWQSDDLLLAQTCGMPYRTRLHGHVQLVAAPDHHLPDCPPGQYFSYLIKRHDDSRDLAALADGTMAYNEALSQSGWAAPALHLQAQGLAPKATLQTGAHLASVAAVLDGSADFAAIDAVTYLMFADTAPDTAAMLHTFERTAPTPALPYITAKGRDTAPLAAALDHAIAALSPQDRATLHLFGTARPLPDAYLAIPTPKSR
ncbi:phosphate/phosphite/phosphonate ABC transporter substrate-binding protein [Pseudosulfitobacter koreensis]|uniref:PhnD/SsuA/transferrin family substrate-binding protein n=1 Tax=Pseudosulfitobacter koreensis TaxID=2968472 RepID=A0ABT1YYK8_9RHOB|nr:PhnD/SsuA/transferrin family substrate-binding protein [Pseudosulfitobacter koreense]